MKKYLLATLLSSVVTLTTHSVYAEETPPTPAASGSNETVGAVVDVAEDGTKSAAHSALDSAATAVGADSELLGAAKKVLADKADAKVGEGADSVRGTLGVALKNAPSPEASVVP